MSKSFCNDAEILAVQIVMATQTTFAAIAEAFYGFKTIPAELVKFAENRLSFAISRMVKNFYRYIFYEKMIRAVWHIYHQRGEV